MIRSWGTTQSTVVYERKEHGPNVACGEKRIRDPEMEINL